MNIVFLDRDGTVITEPIAERADQQELITLFPETLDALHYLAERKYAVIFITNQANIATGTLSLAGFERTHATVLKLLAPSGVTILDTFFCPHGPDGQCDCRKPKPKMLLDAASKYHVDLSTTYMVGDRLTDVQTGKNAGSQTVLLNRNSLFDASSGATYLAKNLLDAATYIADH